MILDLRETIISILVFTVFGNSIEIKKLAIATTGDKSLELVNKRLKHPNIIINSANVTVIITS